MTNEACPRRYIIVDKEVHANLLNKALADQLAADVVIVVAGAGHSMTLGVSFSLGRRVQTAVVIDAHTTSSWRIREDQLGFHDLTYMIHPALRPSLFQGIPTIEQAVNDPEWIAKLVWFIDDDDYPLKNQFQYQR